MKALLEKLLASKTIIANAIMALIALAAIFGYNGPNEEAVNGAISAIVGVVNIVLRFMTSEALDEKVARLKAEKGA